MRALFLAPHNDDEVLFGTFTLLRYRPHVVICFRSERMADPRYPGGMPVTAEERERETAEAMQILGCNWTQWPIGDHKPNAEEVEAWMIGLRDPSGADDWDIVFSPAFEEDGHVDHNMVSLVADSVFGDCSIINYLTYTNGGRSRGEEVSYEPEWVALKHAALSCYRTQAAHPMTRAHFLGDIHEYVL